MCEYIEGLLKGENRKKRSTVDYEKLCEDDKAYFYNIYKKYRSKKNEDFLNTCVNYIGRNAESIEALAGLFVLGIKDEKTQIYIQYYDKSKYIFYVPYSLVRNNDDMEKFNAWIIKIYEDDDIKIGEVNKNTKDVEVIYGDKSKMYLQVMF